jgi:plastocyanin
MTKRNVCIALALISAAACGGSSATGTQSGGNNNAGNTTPPAGGVSVTNNVYDPNAKSVAVGATVVWAWDTCTQSGYSTPTCYQHSVTWDDGTGSATQDQGTYSKTFAVAGTYNYHCKVHPEMTGTVTVGP